MQPLRVYDYLAIARGRIFDQARTLTPPRYLQTFPIGLGSLAATLTHIMTSEWYYVQRMCGAEIPPYDTWPIRSESPPPFDVLEAAWSKQAEDTRAALGSITDWNAPIEYRVTDDAGKNLVVTATAMDQFTQLAFHEVHHRAQAMNILRQVGAAPVGDIDFNAMMFLRRPDSL